MASFTISKSHTSDLEGGFWDDPSAGWTYKGITRKYYPTWPGFKRLEALRLKNFGGKPIPRYTIFPDPVLDAMVAEFYKNNFWNKIYGDYIANQTIANFIYDFFVHKQNDAIRVINDSAKFLLENIATKPTTLTNDVVKVINQDPKSFYSVLRQGRLSYYKNSSKFSAGMKKAFEKRVNKFPVSI